MAEVNKTVFKVWITKFALTKGIYSRQVKACEALGCAGMVKVFDNPYGEMYDRLDWHGTPEEAVKRAEEMRLAKIAGLKKQIAKLDALSFLDLDLEG